MRGGALDRVWRAELDRPAPSAAARLQLLQLAADRQPQNVDAGVILVRALIGEGRPEQGAELVSKLEIRFPGEAKVSLVKAQLLAELGDIPGALAACNAALLTAPDLAARRRLESDLPLIAERLGGWEQTASLADAVVDSGPQFFSRLYRNARLAQRLDAFVAVCDAVLAERPEHTDAIYHKGLALSAAGRDIDARGVLSVTEKVWVGDLEIPAPLGSPQSFVSKLEDEVLFNPTLSAKVEGEATRQGLRSRGDLRRAGTTAMPALFELLKKEALAHTQRHPSLMRLLAGRDAVISAWAVVCGAEGRQKSHRHPNGVVSGVFYVVGTPGPEGVYPGPLRIGEIEPCDGSPAWGVREVEPKPGRLVLFPSYLPHATAPSGVHAPRICIAFDLEAV